LPKPRSSTLENPTSRARLAPRKKPYYVKIAPGIHLGFRRNAGTGTWSVRVAQDGAEWLKKIGLADDLEPAAPPAVLNYWQAYDLARKLARKQPGAAEDESRPLTVAEALSRYERHLTANDGDIHNVSRVRGRLPPPILGKPVALLSAVELKRWRDALVGELAPASINRTVNIFKAALTLAAAHDPRIANARAWKIGLANLPGAHRARNVVLDDDTIRRIIEASYARDSGFGLLVETLATTGARFSQAARLEVGDLQADRARLMVPLSAKGRVRSKRHEHGAAPIPPSLVAKLEHAAAGRPSDAPLLLRGDGIAWRDGRGNDHRDFFRLVVAALGLDPDAVTPYSLRHSNIVRMLKANAPVRIVASLHDTSVAMIEQSYSKHISEHSDDLVRPALLSIEAPSGDKVVALTKRRTK
jgi:integrase